MNKLEIPKIRLFNQKLTSKKYKTVEEAVSALGAVQAQDYEGGLWSIALRVENCTEKDVEEAVANKQIVRTWPMRGTLHFVPAKDAKWMLKNLTPRVIQRTAGLYKKNSLTDEIFNRSSQVISEALKGGKSKTRAEMYDVLNKSGIKTKGVNGILIIGKLAMDGLICFGNKKGKQHTFVLLDEWIKDSIDLSKEEAIQTLALRFFASHGPATVTDFAWWAGVLIEDVNAAITQLGNKLEKIEVENKTYYMTKTSDVAEIDLAILLQAYDEYTIAYKDNPGTIIKHEYLKNYAVPNGFLSNFVVNGMVAGTWKRTVKPNNVIVHTRPFYKLNESEIALLKKSAEDYARFLDLPLVFI